MEKVSGSPSGAGFLFGALQKVSTPASPVPTTPSDTLSATAPHSSASLNVPSYPTALPKPIQQTVDPVNPGAKPISSGGCYAQKMGYRQCLELNPDDKVNCTWALDNYLKCTEDTKMRSL